MKKKPLSRVLHVPAPTFLAGCLAALAASACSGEQAPATPAEVASKTAVSASTPAASPSAPASAAAAPVSDGAVPASQDPANQRGGKRYEGGLERLETQHDLSKVKLGASAAEAGQDGHDHDSHDGHDHDAAPADGSSLLPAAQAQRYAGRFELTDSVPQTKDLGRLRQGDSAAFTFPFLSSGQEPLVISAIKPSCGCTKADIVLVGADGARTAYNKGDPIPVGQRFELETEINTDGRQGPFSSQVSLYANDSRGAFNVKLTAEVEPVLAVTPSPTVYFGRITTKDRVEQTVTVKTTRGEPFLCELAQDALQEPVALEITAKNPDAEGKSSEWEIKVTLGPNAEAGMRHYPINFKTSLEIAHPKYPSPDGSPQYHALMLNVQAQVLGMVSAEPPFLTFGMVKPGEAIERTLRLECHDDFKLTADIPVVIEGLQAQELPWGDRFQVTITPVEDGKAADVKVLLTGLPQDVNGSIGGQLRLKVGHPFLSEIPIRFSAVCRPGLPTSTPANAGTPQK
jgi:hypothetical protein